MNKLDAALNFHETALRVRGQRQELLAANIANADTPGYKARDINFADTFKQALAGASGGLKADTTNPGHIPATASHQNGVLYRSIIQGSVDGNTVDMDVERNQFADNALRYEASATMISGQIKKLLSAIQGQ
ncbi:flagellar basal body rod protein FlgB [Methylobacillus pratensis]|jgi:flagellar basal-body rod protein FlgB|uniref:flagellar basal body rod protein FlgB n=1 Tax=Methylobacillus TaxID=404 RepID=UPI0028539F81|nr:flagellar basal body rod protein FlgB [Methylobacillus flagellatus]MDR5172573.1 flagellar basal body rod protein FlgB [Methylobacillus flagellatus]